MPLPLDRLKSVRTIVSHSNCSDGTASAMILKDVLPEAEVLFVQYKTKEHLELEAKPGMLFCDFSPPPDRVKEFVDIGAMVLDHHDKQRWIVEQFGELGVYADLRTEPGVSGAVLAYREVWEPMLRDPHQTTHRVAAPSFVLAFAELAGVRDTWQTQDLRWPAAVEQNEVLRFFPRESWLERPIFPVDFLECSNADVRRWTSRMGLGKVLVDRGKRTTSMIAEGALYETVGEVKVAIFQALGSAVSDVAELIGDKVDLCMGFTYFTEAGSSKEGSPRRVPKLVVSCRSRRDFDAGAFAVAHGGGGHERSAGFEVAPVKGDDLNPYSYLLRLLQEYVR